MSYWTEVDPPVSFIPEGWTYEQKRAFRFEKLLAYLPEVFNFAGYAGQRVLCIGDGSGIDAIEFARGGATVNVVDMSQKAIDLTKKHAQEAGVEIVADVEDATALHFEDGIFDLVYSFGVIHHIPDVDKAVSEIARVLKPGGSFTGMVYHKDSLLYGYSILRRAEREGIAADEAMRLYSERNPGCPCSRAYTVEELGALFLGKFKEAKMASTYTVVDTLEKRKVVVDAPKELGWHLIFEATR